MKFIMVVMKYIIKGGRNGKIFNRYTHYAVGDYELCKEKERELIKEYKPKYNRQCVIGRVKRG